MLNLSKLTSVLFKLIDETKRLLRGIRKPSVFLVDNRESFWLFLIKYD